MASKKPNYYKEVVKILNELHSVYPTFGIGRHFATAFADYGDVWGLTDKEMYFAMKKYQEELSLDIQNIASDDYVKKIVEDAKDLNHILDTDEEEDDEY